MKGEKLDQKNMSRKNLQEPPTQMEKSSLSCSYTNGKNPKVEEKTVASMAKVREEL